MIFQTKETNELFGAILSIEGLDECGKFFEDICTVKELQDLSQRFQVAKLLKLGKSYQEISKETGASTATISRVNRALVYGSGGYKSVLGRLEDK
ncbi:MAG: hypothetical protein IKT39_00285 [Clostridia bacterium]|nr:hypothetical protein [Clostridia bacterium]